MSDTEATQTIRAATVLARYPRRDPGELVNILHDLQAEFRYLPEEALRETATHLGLAPTQVYGVATFYHGFHTEPRGEHTCTVCMGTACHVRGAPRLLEQLERDTGIGAGQTTPDLSLSIEEVGLRRRLRPRPAGPARRRVPRPHDRGRRLAAGQEGPCRRGGVVSPRLADAPALARRRDTLVAARDPGAQGPRRVRRHRLPRAGRAAGGRRAPRPGRGARSRRRDRGPRHGLPRVLPEQPARGPAARGHRLPARAGGRRRRDRREDRARRPRRAPALPRRGRRLQHGARDPVLPRPGAPAPRRQRAPRPGLHRRLHRARRLRGPRPGARDRARGRPRRGQALGPARPRRRRLPHRPQVGGVPQGRGRPQVRGLQRRRGRPRRLHGRRPPRGQPAQRARGHDHRRLRDGRTRGPRVRAPGVPGRGRAHHAAPSSRRARPACSASASSAATTRSTCTSAAAAAPSSAARPAR